MVMRIGSNATTRVRLNQNGGEANAVSFWPHKSMVYEEYRGKVILKVGCTEVIPTTGEATGFAQIAAQWTFTFQPPTEQIGDRIITVVGSAPSGSVGEGHNGMVLEVPANPNPRLS
jgi:hypothetical protein